MELIHNEQKMRDSAQPAPAVMTEELEYVLMIAKQYAPSYVWDKSSAAIAAVRAQAAEAGIKLPKVRAYLERENAYFTNLRGNEMLLAAIAELDTAEGRK